MRYPSAVIQWVETHKFVYGRLGSVIDDSEQGRLNVCRCVCENGVRISLRLLEMIRAKNGCNYCNFGLKPQQQNAARHFFLINTKIIVIFRIIEYFIKWLSITHSLNVSTHFQHVY